MHRISSLTFQLIVLAVRKLLTTILDRLLSASAVILAEFNDRCAAFLIKEVGF